MRVLVTGAAGFLGSAVRPALAAAGHEVVAADLLAGTNTEPPEGISRVDVRDAAALEPLLRGIDVVCHLAAITDATGPAGFAAHNDLGTAVLLGAMERARVRHLVLASSIVVYGEGRYRDRGGATYFPGLRRRADLDRGLYDNRAPRTGEILTWEPVTEDAPQRPRGWYGSSKAAQENYSFAWGLATGGGVTALRFHAIYGPGARGGWAARYRDELDAGRPPQVQEDGGQVRDFVHLRDAVKALVAAVDRRLPGFVPLNIGSGQPITLWEVASIMAKARGGPTPVVTGRYQLADVRHIVASIEKAKRALGFAPSAGPVEIFTEYGAASRVSDSE
ncbi:MULTISPECIES: NAD(P)-dependent oxidoreductase [unclassified Nocardia]|uniref:NAD-dependent epimerase/dehydratase family protein n=1 Tax=unclassified Nocardia TaxID=2637762 RepID=UPI001CE4ABA2|nr:MULTISPECIES: NAD-dependent epimerase/dehydratase family protein [unclassified Nocardia]